MYISMLEFLKGKKEYMNINKIKVSGFKNLKENEIEFNKITGLLSVNNFGKSNLLQAFDFGISFINAPEKNKNIMMSWQFGIPILNDDFATNYKFEIEFEQTINNEPWCAIYNYEFKWFISKSNNGRIINESLKLMKKNDTQKYTLYIDRNEESGLFRSSLSGRCDKKITIEKNELLINKLKAYDSLYYIELIKAINQLEFYVDRYFDSNELYEVSGFIEKNTDDLSPFSTKEVARSLYKLKEENNNKYKLIINSFMDLFPDIIDISIKEIDLTSREKSSKIPEEATFEYADYAYLLFVKNKHLAKKIFFSQMSDGAKRVLSILTYVTLAEINNIPLIAIEEPENSIHPRLLKKYLDILDQFTEKSKIIITSHSPNMINHMELSNLYLGYPTIDGSAMFKKIKNMYYSRIKNYAADMGMLTGEYLFDLMSSYDESDIEMLKRYLQYE